MFRTRPDSILFVVLIGWFYLATPVRAGWIVDLYGGGGFVNNTEVSITRDTTSDGLSIPFIDAALKDVELDKMITGGLRLGYWFNFGDDLLGFDLGLSLDMFYFPLQIPSQTVQANSNVAIEVTIEGERISVEAGDDQPLNLPEINTPGSVVVAPELMLRQSLLSSPAFPHGRLQPYVTIAPGLLLTDAKPRVSVGIKAGAGLVWQVHRFVGLMAEYRLTHFQFRTDDANLVVEGVTIKGPKIEADLTTHFIVAGISLRF